MNYKILTDKEVDLNNFRNQYVRFSIYDNYLSTSTNKIVRINHLHKYIVQKDIEKSKRNCIFFNMTYNNKDNVSNKDYVNGLKTKEMMYIPNINMVDLDFKSIEQKNQLKIDRGCKSFKNAYLSLLNLLKDDPCVLYMDTSHSRGIKIFFNVVSDYYIKNIDEYIYNFNIENNDLVDYIYKKNAEIVLEYLNFKYDLSYHNDKKIDYYDAVSFKPSQITYSSSGDNLIINKDANILYYNLFIKEDYNSDKNQIDDTNRLESNNKFSNDFFNYINEHPDYYNDVLTYFKTILQHYDERILFSLYYLDDKYLKIYYKLYVNSYGGTGLNKILRDYNTFNRYIHSKKPKFTIALKTIFWDFLKKINYIK